MQTTQRSTGGARSGAGRRTQRVPGRVRPIWNAVTTLRDDTKAEYFYDYAGQDPINSYDPTGELPIPPNLCVAQHLCGGSIFGGVGHVLGPVFVKLAPVLAGGVAGGVSSVFCGVCGVYIGAAVAGATSGAMASVHDHATTSQAVQTGLKDAVISLVTDGAVRGLEPGGESSSEPVKGPAATRVLRIKPHTVAWAKYHGR